MSILITNITEGQPDDGLDRYIVRINKRVICKFKHKRKSNGLAQCLRDAADAVEHQRTEDALELYKEIKARWSS